MDTSTRVRPGRNNLQYRLALLAHDALAYFADQHCNLGRRHSLDIRMEF